MQKNVKNKAAEVDSVSSAENEKVEKNYYPDVAYNRGKRTKFFSLFALLIVSMGIMAGAFISINEWAIALIALMVIIVIACFIPQVIKSYPVKENVPQFTIIGRDVKINGRTFHVQDLESARVVVELAPISKLDSENKEFIKEFASKMPEEPCFGTLALSFKPGVVGVKKGEELYCMVNDCIGALTALVNVGLKHYGIGFSLKKLYENAAFSITKTEIKQQKLSDVSQKDRLKQIL